MPSMPVRGRSSRPVRLRPALDEELDRVPAVHHHVHVLHEDDRVEPRAAEAAADVERSALAQQPADHRQVQVHARGDVRHRIAALVDHVGQEQVVHVAPVAGHVDDLAGGRQAVEILGVPDFDAVVNARQEAARGSARRCARRCANSWPRSRARGGARRAARRGACASCRGSPGARPGAPRACAAPAR